VAGISKRCLSDLRPVRARERLGLDPINKNKYYYHTTAKNREYQENGAELRNKYFALAVCRLFLYSFSIFPHCSVSKMPKGSGGNIRP
jgi:hypothetical protein